MKSKRSLSEKTKRFLSIIKYRKKQYTNFFMQAIFRGVYVLLHVIFIEKFVFLISENNIEAFHKSLYVYGALIIGYEVIWYFTKKHGWVETLPRSQADLQRIFLDKFIRLDNTEVEKIGTGKLIGIISSGIEIWVEYLAIFIEKGIALIISVIFSIYLVSEHGILFVLIFFSIITISTFVLVLVNRYQFRFRSERYEVNNENLRSITKILMTKNEILQTGRFGHENDLIRQQLDRQEDINKRMSGGRFLQNRSIPFAVAILLLLVFVIYGNRVFYGDITISQLVGMTSILLVIQGIINEFVSFYINLTKKFISIEKLWDFFDCTPVMKGYNTGRDFIYIKGVIHIKNLDFSYIDGKKVFDNFSLNLEGEKITAFVGNSGSGKTTLVKLISGYITSDKGYIEIDGQKLSEVSLKSFYKSIGYLSQEPSVFDGSIIDNLSYALEKETDNTVLEKVIVDSKCEFIYDLPDGLKTEIGERGIRLSGGQRQRLAIAKIMLKNPKIIILDEPTSALDSFSEEKITNAMNNLFKNRTVLVIAHRLQTVKHASRILVMEDGKIVEDGDHKSLEKKKGVYYKMLELQSGF